MFYSKSGSCFNYGIEKCNGACVEKEDPASYNKRVQQFIDKHSYKNKSMIITDRGRKSNERSFVLIENGIFKGIGFYDRNNDISDLDYLNTIIEPMSDNRDAKHIIQTYARSRKRLKVIALEHISNS